MPFSQSWTRYLPEDRDKIKPCIVCRCMPTKFCSEIEIPGWFGGKATEFSIYCTTTRCVQSYEGGLRNTSIIESVAIDKWNNAQMILVNANLSDLMVKLGIADDLTVKPDAGLLLSLVREAQRREKRARGQL